MGAGEMLPCLRALSTLEEDLNPVSSTHMVAPSPAICNPSSSRPVTGLGAVVLEKLQWAD